VLRPARKSSSYRDVPARVPRPPYISGDTTQSALDTQGLIERVRRASQLAARTLAHTAAFVAPGVTTNALDAAAHEFLCDHGAYPSPLGYRGFPKSICTSKNEVICHGIPDDVELAAGDIVNIDVTAYLDGVHGDTSATFAVGEIDDESRLLLERTREALVRGVGAVVPGRPLRVIGTVIEAFANRFDYGVVRDFTGHGIGQDFHTGLIVPHYDDPELEVVMQPGMVFTIEPMLTLGTIDYDLAADGWTVTTADNKRSAQFEHTVAVTDTGVDLLSALP
jgi:methionyl aminopeptidase